MSVLTTSLDFSESGYTYDSGEVSLSLNECKLISTVGDAIEKTVITPAIDTSTWDAINRITVTMEEETDVELRFLVSFDGSTWQRYNTAGWSAVSVNDIATLGMTRYEIENVRRWSELSAEISLAIFFDASTGWATSPVLEEITIHYRTDGGDESLSVSDEPAATETLETELQGIYPDIGFSVQYATEISILETQGGDTICSPKSTGLRRVITGLSWTALTESQKDDVEEFLIKHYENPFNWTVLGDSSASKWYVVEEPAIEPPDHGPYTVKTTLMEAL